jgi:predicted GH43/DUF377 family glycosyl hydrolase
MIKYSFLLLLLSYSLAANTLEFPAASKKIVVASKQLVFEEYPDAFNPSIIKVDQGFLLTFRYCPNVRNNPWHSHIGVVLLNEKLEPISEPQLLETRSQLSKTESQAEDARIFSFRGRIFLIYNDCVDIVRPSNWDRRDMFIAELNLADNHCTLSAPLKLCYSEKYNTRVVQKNWVPFEWNKSLLFIYTLHPHEILFANLTNGSCYQCHQTDTPLPWNYGEPRGSTPPLLIDGEYLAFFHSATQVISPSSWGQEMWHYFMGAYTFSPEPPFTITKMTPSPIIGEGFYTPSTCYKRVVFPGGFVVSGSSIYVAYGKDDCEIWIATIDKEALKATLKRVEKLR